MALSARKLFALSFAACIPLTARAMSSNRRPPILIRMLWSRRRRDHDVRDSRPGEHSGRRAVQIRADRSHS